MKNISIRNVYFHENVNLILIAANKIYLFNCASGFGPTQPQVALPGKTDLRKFDNIFIFTVFLLFSNIVKSKDNFSLSCYIQPTFKEVSVMLLLSLIIFTLFPVLFKHCSQEDFNYVDLKSSFQFLYKLSNII